MLNGGMIASAGITVSSLISTQLLMIDWCYSARKHAHDALSAAVYEMQVDVCVSAVAHPRADDTALANFHAGADLSCHDHRALANCDVVANLHRQKATSLRSIVEVRVHDRLLPEDDILPERYLRQFTTNDSP